MRLAAEFGALDSLSRQFFFAGQLVSLRASDRDRHPHSPGESQTAVIVISRIGECNRRERLDASSVEFKEKVRPYFRPDFIEHHERHAFGGDISRTHDAGVSEARVPSNAAPRRVN